MVLFVVAIRQLPEPTPTLIECEGPRTGKEYSLTPGANILGRGEGASIQVTGADISRRHARVDVEPDGVFLTDLGSKNGVYVDGTRAPSSPGARARLGDGSRIELGDVVLRLDDPGAKVGRVLADGGEATITRRRPTEPAPPRLGLAAPLFGIGFFALLVYLLLGWPM